MAPATKRRRVVSSFEPSRGVSVVAPAGGIASFGRISKTMASDGLLAKESKLAEADINILNGLGGKSRSKSGGAKRKSETELHSPYKSVKTESGAAHIKIEGAENISPLPTITEIRSTTPELPSQATRRQNTKNLAVVEPDTPTKSARARLESLAIKSSPVKQERSSPSQIQSSSSPSLPTPCPKKRRRDDNDDDLPKPVQDFLSLHSAFLTALSLHYAHHGTATPVDIRQLSSSVAKSWGRRAISADDVRRLLGVQQRSVDSPAQAALLSVWDYGRGKACIEYCPPAATQENGGKKKKAWGAPVARQPLESATLVKAFGTYLRQQYALFVAGAGQDAESNADNFIAELPLARLHKRATSKAAKSVLVSKGQTRLTELKSGAITRHAKDASKDSLSSSTSSSSPATNTTIISSSPTAAQTQQHQQNGTGKPSLPPSKRTDSLLSRIRAKESLLAAQPAGPTAAQLARRAALQRAPDVIGVLTVLASNSGRSANSPFSSVARSGLLPTSSPLAQRMSSVSLGGSGIGGNSDDDALLAALGGGKNSFSSSSSRGHVGSNGRGLDAMFGSSSPTLSMSPASFTGASISSSYSSSSSSSTGGFGSSAVSMSLQQIVERVQNSMRAPIARTEAEDVLRLIASDVAPHWLQIREVGSIKAVTIRADALEAGWKERVEELLKTA